MFKGEFDACINDALGIDVEAEYRLIASATDEGVRMHASPTVQAPLRGRIGEGQSLSQMMRENAGVL